MNALKTLVSTSLRRMGLELRKLKSHHTDPYGDQQRLLAGDPARVVFDLGASVGDATAIYRNLFPDATIYSFEPTEGPFETCRRRYANDPKVVAVRAAVGATSGTATLYVNAFDQTNSLLPTDPGMSKLIGGDEAKTVGQQTVPVISLGDFCREKNIDRIDLLKMDIQGFELNALKGATALLEKHAVRLVYTEVLFGRGYQGQAYYHELAQFLQQHDYELYGLYALARGANGVLSQADAIFMSPQVRARLW